MLPQLDTYDWECAFIHATPVQPLPPASKTLDLNLFEREDVQEILAMVEGENDGPNWVIVGKLKDGRFFLVDAGCDYTGWDCRAGGWGAVAATYEDLVSGLTPEDCERLKIGR